LPFKCNLQRYTTVRRSDVDMNGHVNNVAGLYKLTHMAWLETTRPGFNPCA
jgi:acyl-ACP thioesterase